MKRISVSKKPLLLCVAAFTVFFVNAQFTIKNPSFKSKESGDITLNTVRIYPDSLILDLAYFGNYSYREPGFYINPTSRIEFSYGGTRLYADWASKVMSLVNARYRDITLVSKGATHNFSVIFPFSLYKLFGNKSISTERIESFFSAPDPLAISFINCDDNYRRSNNLVFGNCFDIYKINLQMPVQNWATLWCSGFLNNHYQKDEFETTVKYRERISPQSTKTALIAEIRKVYGLFAYSYLAVIDDEIPEIKYDSDTETFSIKYTGAERMSVTMPISVAPSFKQRILDKTLKISDIEVLNYSTGNKYLSSITYKDNSGKKTTIENKMNVSGAVLNSVVDNITAALREKYPDL